MPFQTEWFRSPRKTHETGIIIESSVEFGGRDGWERGGEGEVGAPALSSSWIPNELKRQMIIFIAIEQHVLCVDLLMNCGWINSPVRLFSDFSKCCLTQVVNFSQREWSQSKSPLNNAVKWTIDHPKTVHSPQRDPQQSINDRSRLPYSIVHSDYRKGNSKHEI